MWLKNALTPLSLFGCVLAICKLQDQDIGYRTRDNNRRRCLVKNVIVTCKNTTNDDFNSEIFLIDYEPSEYYKLFEFSIENSNFSVIKNLDNPVNQFFDNRFYWDFKVILKIRLSHISDIAGEAFKKFTNLIHLDLGYNNITDSNFIADLPSSVTILNLTHNKITHINFRNYFELESLDLSYNKLKEIEFVKSEKIGRFPIWKNLNLFNNEISVIDMPPIFYEMDDLEISLANNPLKQIKNCQILNQNKDSRVKLLNLSNSLNSLALENIANCQTIFFNLILSNNLITSNSNISYIDFEFHSLDLSNCKINNIESFNIEDHSVAFLNLSNTNLEFLNKSIFSNVIFENYLDLSFCNITNVDNIFQKMGPYNLILKANKISELTSKSFTNMTLVFNMDLSFNNITLNNNSFVNCKMLVSLNLINNNINNIDENAFAGLNSLKILHLENNFLQSIKSNVLEHLTNINEIYLENNKLTILQSFLFSSSPLSIVNVSGNNIQLIENRSFFNLNNIEILQINNNHGPLTITNGAFSELEVLKEVNLSCSGLNKINLDIFDKTPRLKIIDVRENNLTILDFSNPTDLRELQEILLTFRGDIKSKSFLGLPYLRNLSIWHSDIGTIEKGAFQGLFNLKSLKIINSTIRKFNEGAFNGLFRLNQLDIKNIFRSQLGIDREIFQDVRELPRLDLSSQGLQHIISYGFRGLRNMQSLYLNNNNLSSFEICTFSGLNSLRILDLSNNTLKIIESTYFNGLNGLVSLNLSENVINDIELGALQHFPNLTTLILRKNNLSDFKIGTFSNLLKLESLDLSQNSISSILFEVFLPLRYLEYLNLDFNNLKTIGPQFSLISNFTYLKKIGIAKNKWQCEYLGKMLVTLRSKGIDYSSTNLNYYSDNIEGLDCIDVCKYLLCLKDSHGIN